MSINKKARFEVFKRDNFTCQYCGRSAPDVTLQVDHIHPVSKGGEDDILNLVTSCADCNQGKRNRLLSDDTAIKKRKRQLDELQERREQLEMMIEWHQSLIDLEEQTVNSLAEIWDNLVPGYHANENGLKNLRKWNKRFTITELIDAIKTSVDQYLEYDNDSDDPSTPTEESVEKAFVYIPKIAASKRKIKDRPYLNGLYYARGILRNRLSYWGDSYEWRSIKLMEAAHLNGWSIEEIQSCTKTIPNWSSFIETMTLWADLTPSTEIASQPTED